jgi:hypothetical protein
MVSANSDGSTATGPTGSPSCLVTTCRDCCCGTRRKHPEVDHDEHLARLRAGLAGSARVRVSRCLDTCDQSNVIVVNPSRDGRRTGGRPIWLGLVLDDAGIDDVIAWVRGGGPGVAEAPATLGLYEFTPAGRRGRPTRPRASR